MVGEVPSEVDVHDFAIRSEVDQESRGLGKVREKERGGRERWRFDVNPEDIAVFGGSVLSRHVSQTGRKIENEKDY